MPPLVPLLAYKNLCSQEKCLEQLSWRGTCKRCQHKPSSGQRNGKLGAQEGNAMLQKLSREGQQAVAASARQGSSPRSRALPVTGADAASGENGDAPASCWNPATMQVGVENIQAECFVLPFGQARVESPNFCLCLWLLSRGVFFCFSSAQRLVHANEAAFESKTVIKYPKSN